jgi:hypothetical protein
VELSEEELKEEALLKDEMILVEGDTGEDDPFGDEEDDEWEEWEDD